MAKSKKKKGATKASAKAAKPKASKAKASKAKASKAKASKATSSKGKKGKAPKRKLPKSLRKGALPTSVEEVWAAGVGALGDARKQGSEAFDALVERGERVVETGSKAARSALGDVEATASKVTRRVRATADETVDGVQDRVERAVEAALSTLGLPKREEISALRALVDGLEARLAALGVPEAPADVTAYEVVAHDDGWAIRTAGAERALSVVRTKKEALRDARQTARAHAPSRLTVFNLDGSEGETTDYDA
ncbi:MAG: phasin family protein [Bacteroidota bacterium]